MLADLFRLSAKGAAIPKAMGGAADGGAADVSERQGAANRLA